MCRVPRPLWASPGAQRHEEQEGRRALCNLLPKCPPPGGLRTGSDTQCDEASPDPRHPKRTPPRPWSCPTRRGFLITVASGAAQRL